MDNVIREFLSGRKADWIKKKSHPAMTDEDMLILEQNASHVFSFDNWLPDAAKRASQLSLVSHPSKFSHPGAKTTPVIAESSRLNDGFLRTGNVNAALDVFGNAAAMDVFKFLSLQLNDGVTILKHLQCNTAKIQEELSVESIAYETLRAGFLAIEKTDTAAITSEKVKQIYFPVAGNYHLLSILTPSGLMFELRNRIQTIRFSEQKKAAQDDKKKNVYNDSGFDELYDLSMIAYGGTKPQNISVLNNTYGGKAYLLPCFPPLLMKQKQRLPKYDFFTNCLWRKNFDSDFISFHKLLTTNYNNKAIRAGFERRIESILDGIIETMWLVRLQNEGWSTEENYSQLPIHQKIWLDEYHKQERSADDLWLNTIIHECARWITHTYKNVFGNQAVYLDDTELIYIKNIIKLNKEGLQ